MEQNKLSIDTQCVQAGWTPKNGEPRQLPIYQSTTFKYESTEQMGRLFDLKESGYFYSRLQNPTCDSAFLGVQPACTHCVSIDSLFCSM